MKKIMKVVSLVLTFALMVGMAIPSTVFAAVSYKQDTLTPATVTDTANITLKPTTDYGTFSGRKYVAYRILNLTAQEDADTYSLPFQSDPTGVDGVEDGAQSGNYVVRTDIIKAINNAHTNNASLLGSSDLENTANLQVILDHLRHESQEGGTNTTLANNAKIEDFAKEMKKFIDANDTVYNPLKVEFTYSSSGNSYTTTEKVPFGYYIIIDNTLASETPVSAVITLNNDLADGESIFIKATKPTLKKEITNEAGESAAKGDDATVGDIVYFKLTTKVPNALGYNMDDYTFKITDTLSKGLELVSQAGASYPDLGNFNQSQLKVKIGTHEITPPAGSSSLISASASKDVSSGKTTLIIDLSKLARAVATGDASASDYHVNDEIVITYKAKLNSDAVIGKSIDNSAILQYSNDPNDEDGGTAQTTTTPDTHTYTFGLKIEKFQGDGTTPLAGAGFVLRKGTQYATVGDPVDVDNTNVYTITGWEDDIESAGEFTVNSKGVVQINGLGDSTEPSNYYTLIEKTVPGTYFDINGDVNDETGVNFTVTSTYQADGTIQSLDFALKQAYNGVKDSSGKSLSEAIPEEDNSTGTIGIINSKREPLPETGGMGTTLLYVVGGALIVIAGVLLISKRRMHAAR